MATTVDERIVAAKFDASDFEKGVDKTVKKLDELKKSLDFKEATKSVKELAEKTEVSTDSMSKSLDKLTERFTTFVGMVKQKILGGLADEVAGVFLRMEQGVKSFIKSISSDQVSAGMGKYEQMLTSVRVMMSAGKGEEESYKAIERLQEYSDETSYSLSQMTDAMSKMVAAGVDLDEASKNVEGIANACANAGINATDASRAFYNLSQAYSSGVLKYTDYRSLELLNLTTSEFKEAMLESAEAAGTLKKVGDGVWQTINKNDKKVTAGKKITEKNLSDALKYNFMNTNAMNQLFGGKYWMEVIGRDELQKLKKQYKELYGDNWEEELKKKYGKLAVTAFEAAREARSFTDVLNALKDAVSTGWSTTFQHLFGKLSEAKDFFTDLSNGALAQVIYDIGTYRNAILEMWNGETADGIESGGSLFRQTIFNITEALGEFFHTFLQILPGFDELEDDGDDAQKTLKALGDKLFDISMTIRDFSMRLQDAAHHFNEFMNDKITEDGPTRIELIRQVVANLSSVFSIFGKVLQLTFSAVSKTFYTLSPIFDGFMKLLSKVTEPLVNLKNNQDVFNDLEYSIENIQVILKPVAETLGTILGFAGEIAGFIAQMALDTLTSNIQFFADALGLVMELITGNSSQLEHGEGVINSIKEDFEGIKKACTEGLSALKEFFSTLISDIRILLGLTDGEEKDNQNGGVFSGLINFFNTNEFVQKAKAWVSQAIVDVGNFIKSIPSRIAKFGANIYDTLYKLFFTVETKDNNGKIETKAVLTPLGEWLKGVINNIKEFLISLPNKIIEGVGKVGNWIDEIFNYWFVKGPEQKQVDARGNESVYTPESRFNEFVTNTLSDIRVWFENLPYMIRDGLKSVGNFFTKLFEAVDEFLFGKKIVAVKRVKGNQGLYKTTFTRYKSGFSKWLDGVIQDVKKFILKIPEYVKQGIKGAGDIISTIINALFGSPDDGSGATSKNIEDRLEAPFLGINLNGILETIKDIGITLINQIARIFTGTDDVTKNQEFFSKIIATGIDWIREKAEKAFDWVLEFFRDLPTKIANFFTKESKDDQDSGPIGKAISDFGGAIGHFIENIPSTVADFFTNAIKEFGNLWNDFYKGIIGETEKKDQNITKWAEDQAGYPKSYAHDSGRRTAWENFVEKLGTLISTAFENLPTWIAEGIHASIVKVQELFGTITEWLKGENVAAEMQKAAEEAAKQADKGAEKVGTEAAKATTDSTTKAMEKSEKDAESPLLTAIKGIGQSIYNLIVTTIPDFLQNAWTWVVREGGNVWKTITGLFDGYEQSDFKKTIDHIGEVIGKAINNVKQFIIDGFNSLFGKTDWKTKLKASDDMYMTVVNEVENQQRQAKDRLKDDPNNKSFFDIIKDNISSLFSEDGPLSGDIGQKILDFFIKTLPNLIGKAIGSFIKVIPTFISNLNSGIISVTASETKEGEQAAQNAEEAMDNISDVFARILNTFMTSLENGSIGDYAAHIIRLLAIIELLKGIREIFSTINVTKNLAEKSEASNSFFAAIKRIGLAIMVTFGLVTYISTLPDEKRKTAENILTDLIDLFKILSTWTGIGKVVGDVTDTIETVADDITDLKKAKDSADDELTKMLDESGNKVGDKFLTGLGNAAVKTGKGFATASSITMIGSAVGSVIDSLLVDFNNIGTIFDTLASNIKTGVENLITLKDKIDTAIEVFGKAIDLAKMFPELAKYKGDASTASQTLTEISGGLANFTQAVSGKDIKATEIVNAIDNLVNMKDKMVEFANFANEGTTFEDFKYAVASLGSAFSLFSGGGEEFDIPKEGFISTMVRAITELLGNDEFIGLVSSIEGKTFPGGDEAYKAAESMIIFAGSLKRLGNASKGLSAKTGEDISGFIAAVGKIDMSPIGANGEVTTKADQLAELANAIGVFATNTQGLTQENVQTAEYAMNVLAHLAVSIKSAGQGFLEKAFLGESSLDTFSIGIKNIGDALGHFFKAVEGLDDNNKTPIKHDFKTLEMASILLQDLAHAMQIFGANDNPINADKVTKAAGTFETVGENMKKFMVVFNDPSKWEGGGFDTKSFGMIENIVDIFGKLSDIVAKISGVDNMQDKMNEFYKMAFGQYDPMGNMTSAKYEHGFFFTMKNLLVAFGSFYSELKKENNKFGISDKDITGFYTSVAQMFKAMSYMTSVGFGVAGEDFLSQDYEFATIKESYTDIVDILRYFNDNLDVVTSFLNNVSTYNSAGVRVAGSFFNAMGDLARAMNLFADISPINHGIMNLKNFDWGTLSSIIDNMISAFSINVLKTDNQEKIQDIGSNIAKRIFDGIQAAFLEDQELRPVVTPVLNLEPMKEQMREAFGTDMSAGVDWEMLANTVFNANSQTDEDHVRASVLNAKIDEVTGAVNDLANKQITPDQLIDGFKGIGIYMDGDAMVFAIGNKIDEFIGEKIGLIESFVTPK